MIVATAGHVDHGKTSLVRNLTGVETDRLEEEQRRGLSISLGYAYWRPDDDTAVGFIDVPGHRRFINNMISGISGIDLGMLVVAADDGPMPQTREHLQVMDLLGVERFILVISKCDRVDEKRVDAVTGDAAAMLPANTPVYTISNTSGSGIDELRSEIGRLARNWTARASSGLFRMSIDRTFHLQGHGLILTGTIASGSITNSDTVKLQPQGKILRVRGIHAQDAPAVSAQAGDRCALNVSGDVHKDDIERGDWVAGESCIEPTSRFDARIRLLPDAAFPLKHLAEVKLHIGAKHLKARLILLRGDRQSASRIRPGETALAQLVPDRPVLCCHGDRFLLRDHGETATLGGGVVLDPLGLKQRKSTPARLAFLAAMENEDIEDAIRAAVDGQQLLDHANLLKAWNVDPGDRAGEDLGGIIRIKTPDGEFWLAESLWLHIKKSVLAVLLELHQNTPAEPGVTPAQLMRAALSAGEQPLFPAAIAELAQAGDIRFANRLITSTDHKATPSRQEDKAWQAIAACLGKHGRQIPNLVQLEEECGIARKSIQNCLARAQRDGRIIRINADRYAETALIAEFAQTVLELTEDKPTLAVAECRDRLGCGRNVLVEVLEYFDGLGFTRRVGNQRIILDRGLPEKQFAD